MWQQKGFCQMWPSKIQWLNNPFLEKALWSFAIYCHCTECVRVYVCACACVCVCFAASADLLYADSFLQSCRHTCSYHKFLRLPCLSSACIATTDISYMAHYAIFLPARCSRKWLTTLSWRSITDLPVLHFAVSMASTVDLVLGWKRGMQDIDHIEKERERERERERQRERESAERERRELNSAEDKNFFIGWSNWMVS